MPRSELLLWSSGARFPAGVQQVVQRLQGGPLRVQLRGNRKRRQRASRNGKRKEIRSRGFNGLWPRDVSAGFTLRIGRHHDNFGLRALAGPAKRSACQAQRLQGGSGEGKKLTQGWAPEARFHWCQQLGRRREATPAGQRVAQLARPGLHGGAHPAGRQKRWEAGA